MNDKTCGECCYLDENRYCNFLDFEPKPQMKGCANFEPKPTNGDRIRQGNNRKLAHLFANPCPPGVKKTCNGNDRVECENCWFEYLNASAESEGNNG